MYHNQHLSIAKEVGDRAREGTAYCNLGNAYESLGDFKQAIVYHNQELSIAKEVGDRAREGTAYCNLGNAYESLGDFKQAIVYHNPLAKLLITIVSAFIILMKRGVFFRQRIHGKLSFVTNIGMHTLLCGEHS